MSTKKYRSLSDIRYIEKSNDNSLIQSTQSLQSMKTYFQSKFEKKKYLYNFFKKEDIKIEKSEKYNFNSVILPENYYVWKGLCKGETHNNNIDTNIFFADKSVAARYGTSRKGTDLQFKIIHKMKLLDISDFNNMKIIWKILDSITIEQISTEKNTFINYIRDNYINNITNGKESIHDTNFLKKCIQYYKELLVETLVNFNHSPKKYYPKTPTKCERKSNEDFDPYLVDFISKIDDDIDGWIHFESDLFHNEILVFNTKKHLKYIDFHII